LLLRQLISWKSRQGGRGQLAGGIHKKEMRQACKEQARAEGPTFQWQEVQEAHPHVPIERCLPGRDRVPLQAERPDARNSLSHDYGGDRDWLPATDKPAAKGSASDEEAS
jgi:hypothetical protein